MDEVERQARDLIALLRAEAAAIGQQISDLEDRHVALLDSIAGLTTLYPDRDDQDGEPGDEAPLVGWPPDPPPAPRVPSRLESVLRGAREEPKTRFEPASDAEGRTLRELIILVLEKTPKRYVTVRQIAEDPLIQALNLADTEAAVRASMRRMNGRLKTRKINGRTKGFRLAPAQPAQRTLEQAG